MTAGRQRPMATRVQAISIGGPFALALSDDELRTVAVDFRMFAAKTLSASYQAPDVSVPAGMMRGEYRLEARGTPTTWAQLAIGLSTSGIGFMAGDLVDAKKFVTCAKACLDYAMGKKQFVLAGLNCELRSVWRLRGATNRDVMFGTLASGLKRGALRAVIPGLATFGRMDTRISWKGKAGTLGFLSLECPANDDHSTVWVGFRVQASAATVAVGSDLEAILNEVHRATTQEYPRIIAELFKNVEHEQEMFARMGYPSTVFGGQ